MSAETTQCDRLTPTERAQLNELVAAGREAVDELDHLQAENERLERMLVDARRLNDELSALIAAAKANR